MKGVEQKLVQIVMDEIVEGGARVNWTDIVGQEVRGEKLVKNSESLPVIESYFNLQEDQK